jgi:homoserine dehydrogenase
MSDEGKEYSSMRDIHQALAAASRGTDPVIFIDCTASDKVPEEYKEILDNNIHIATPNKKGMSGKLALYKTITESTTHAIVFHEATVGAGLPVISTLKDLIHTGDKITKIEGIFSGTLSYIFNVWGGGNAKFSDVVREAKEKGYTEPDPRDDLNGMDVARKLTILARISGLEVEGPPSSDIFPIESLIPKALETAQSGDEFVAGLPFHDAEFDEKRTAAKQAGKVVRFVGSIDVATSTIKVGLQSFVHLSKHLIVGTQRRIHLHHCRDQIISLRSIPNDMGISRLSYKALGMCCLTSCSL